ncbi:MAG: hypothetical protein KAJ63_15750, partial [Methyloprofundus sp.]|nr:hypothetical protein [Methyloprofundus sp.]
MNGQTLLITQSPADEAEGVELRKGRIQLTADSRIEEGIRSLSSTGWQQKFNKVSAVLHLPPGWHLLGVSGVDNVPSSWIARWTLLDLFLVLIAALAISRLWNNYGGLFALITLALIWHEAGAPRFIWLNILAAIALIKVLPQGKFLHLMQYYRLLSGLVLLIICLPFLVDQVRTGLYPQLEKPWQQASRFQKYPKSMAIATDAVMLAEESLAGLAKAPRKLRAEKDSYYSPSRPKFKRIDPNANLQTGPGLPQWQWARIPLSWNGSVDSQQQIRFWYLNPSASLLLNFLRVIVVITLGLLVVGMINQRFKFKMPALAANLCLLMLFMLPLTPAYADMPSPALLKELKQRLLKAPDCLPNCAQISTLQLSINSKTLNLTLQVHAQKRVAIPLPAKYKQWLPNNVLVDNSPAKAIIRDKQGLIWLNLEPGIHQLVLSGNAPLQASFTLPLPLKPHYMTHTVKGWTIEGLKKNGTVENQLHFTRIKSTGQADNKLSPLNQDTLPAFIRIERTLHLGLDWHISTRVVRAAQEATAVTLKVPLLTGESISSANIRSEKGYALVHMTANQRSIEWQSLLEKSAAVTLQAPETKQWTEVWRADISPIWHINSTGIAAIHHQDQAGNWLPSWQPWPSETVTLSITRPKAVQGQTLTIDKSILHITSGKRSQKTRLELDVRSSKGTQHSLKLPQNAQLESVRINGKTQPIRQQQQIVTLPIKPGKQHYQLNWYETKQQASVLTTAALDLGIASVNSHIKVSLGQDRWVLLTTGPQLGPAVLFWG